VAARSRSCVVCVKTAKPKAGFVSLALPREKAQMAKKAKDKRDDGLRDAIAIEAMQALIASRGFTPASDPGAATMLARSAYAIADAMMGERAHKEEPPPA
jgi:hypothetical protein